MRRTVSAGFNNVNKQSIASAGGMDAVLDSRIIEKPIFPNAHRCLCDRNHHAACNERLHDNRHLGSCSRCLQENLSRKRKPSCTPGCKESAESVPLNVSNHDEPLAAFTTGLPISRFPLLSTRTRTITQQCLRLSNAVLLTQTTTGLARSVFLARVKFCYLQIFSRSSLTNRRLTKEQLTVYLSSSY